MRSALFIAALLAPCALAQTIRQESIPPQATDPAITQWTTAHIAAIDTSRPPRNRLFVYLHGLGGAPGGATDLIRTAAAENLYAVGITYANDWAPFEFCSNKNSDCYENLRREILDGVDRSPYIAVSATNSVQNRLAKLIAYLDAAHPGEGWNQFLDAGAPRWSAIVVWGHSQGGANAAVLARHHVLAGVITSAPAADFVGPQPAAWWSTHVTPTERYFGFCHTQDQLSAKLAAWGAIGQPGPVRDVATVPEPYFMTHQLSTSTAPAQAGQYHNSVVSNAFTPRNTDGTPVYAPAWRYMILGALGTCTADFDGDGDVGTDSDIEAFFACLGGNCCAACGSADFDQDGDTGTDGDIEAFFRVLGGGVC